MRLYLRNKMSGEIRDVEADSPEFEDLKKEVTPGGLSMWEQTNIAHASAVKERAAHGELLEEDLGHEDQDKLRYAALQLDLEGVAPESNPHLALTPGEIEAGLTPSDKLHDLQQMYDMNRVRGVGAVYDDAADRIADERVDRESAQPARGQSARAGGSDDREGTPSVQARDEEDGTPSTQSKTGARSASQAPPVGVQSGGGQQGGGES